MANLTESACNEIIVGSKIHIWEVFFHVMSLGARQHNQIVEMLKGFGFEIKPETYMSFFHPNETMELESAKEAPRIPF